MKALGKITPGRMLAAVGVMVPTLYYLFNLSPSLPWLDSGELIAASWVLGTSHQPGHPLYMLLSKMLAYILPGNIAFRYNLVSLIFAAAALALAGRLFRDILIFLFKDRDDGSSSFGLLSELCAAAGVVALGFCPSFAMQALRAEVYTLNFALVCLILWAGLKVFMTRGSERRVLLVPLVFFSGLGLSVHNLTVILLVPFTVLALAVIGVDMVRDRTGIRRDFSAAAAALLLSLLPFLHLVLASRSEPYIDASHVASVRDFFEVFFASAYRESFVESGAPFSLPKNLVLFWETVGIHVIPAMFALAAAGLMVMVKRNRLLGLAVFSAAVFPCLGLITQQTIFPENIDHGAYVLPSLLLIVLLAVTSLRFLAEVALIARHFGGRFAAGRVFSALLVLMLAGSQVMSEVKSITMKDSTSASAHADMLDAILPADSIVILNNDEVAFPLLYIQGAEGRRLDVLPGFGLQLGRPRFYDVARRYWSDRLPPRSEVPSGPELDAGKLHLGFLVALVRSGAGRWPLLWDQTGKDVGDLDPEMFFPFYHLAMIAPPGQEDVRIKWRNKGGARSLDILFQNFIEPREAFIDSDTFAFWRLARRSLAATALLYDHCGNPAGFEVVNTLALTYVPNDPILLFNQGIVMERKAAYEQALYFYTLALEEGYSEQEIIKATERVGALMARGHP